MSHRTGAPSCPMDQKAPVGSSLHVLHVEVSKWFLHVLQGFSIHVVEANVGFTASIHIVLMFLDLEHISCFFKPQSPIKSSFPSLPTVASAKGEYL